jgi:2-keto-myo-inositol isomerase
LTHFATRTAVTIELKRRDLLAGSTKALAGGILAAASGGVLSSHAEAARGEATQPVAPEPKLQADRFLLGLNTSTIRGQKLSIVEEIAIAAKAGYQAMEPWIDELERYAATGGSLEDLGKRFRDAGISVESAIGFFDWIVDDPDRRRKGLEAARRSMELVRRIGGKRLAAPPAGATNQPISDLSKIAAHPGSSGRGGLCGDRVWAPEGLHLARRLSPLSRRVPFRRHQASRSVRHPRLPFQRLPG